eukprot:7678025-Pyramimonas_sp.AAC.1
MYQLQIWRAGRFQQVALSTARCTVISKGVTASRIKGGQFSRCGYRLSAAHIRYVTTSTGKDTHVRSPRTGALAGFKSVRTHH